MMRGAKGVGMGDLLAKGLGKPYPDCSLYHIFTLKYALTACNEFTKCSTRLRREALSGVRTAAADRGA
jgi:hypothetical protein